VNDAARVHKLKDIARQAAALAMALGEVHPASGTTVLDRIRQAEPGLRAAAFDGARRSGGVSDPTGRQAADGGTTPDRARGVLAELDGLIASMFDGADRVAQIVAANGPPRRPNDADRLALERDNRRGIPGCESCARVAAKDDPKDRYYVEADPRFTSGTQVVARGEGREYGITGGVPRLDRPWILCTGCYGFVRDRWRLPTVKELEAERDGTRRDLRVPVDEEKQIRTRRLARVAEHARELAEARAGTGADSTITGPGGGDSAVAS
jgi:hypothetical protein